MITKDKFWNYYYNYLGIKEKSFKSSEFIFESSQRNKSMNNRYFQPLVVTNIDGRFICSISPKYVRDFRGVISKYNQHNFENLNGLLDIYFNDKLENYNIRKMYRLTIEDTNINQFYKSSPVVLTKEILMKGLRNISLEEKEDIWRRKKKK